MEAAVGFGGRVSGHRHAPRGPMKARDTETDPIHPKDPMRCSATRRNGDQCGSKPIRGGTVCRMHGGGAPQVKAKAAERLKALQPKAITTLDQLLDRTEFPTVQFQAAKAVIDWTEGKAGEKVNVEHSGGITIQHEVPA